MNQKTEANTPDTAIAFEGLTSRVEHLLGERLKPRVERMLHIAYYLAQLEHAAAKLTMEACEIKAALTSEEHTQVQRSLTLEDEELGNWTFMPLDLFGSAKEEGACATENDD